MLLLSDRREHPIPIRHIGVRIIRPSQAVPHSDNAIERLKSRIKPGSVVMLFFGGYGVQSGRESYMIPIDATIWKESGVRHEGISIEAVLDVMKERGARAKLVVLGASKRVIGVRDIFRQKAARASPSVKQLTHPSSEIH